LGQGVVRWLHSEIAINTVESRCKGTATSPNTCTTIIGREVDVYRTAVTCSLCL